MLMLRHYFNVLTVDVWQLTCLWCRTGLFFTFHFQDAEIRYTLTSVGTNTDVPDHHNWLE